MPGLVSAARLRWGALFTSLRESDPSITRRLFAAFSIMSYVARAINYDMTL